jgi:hypothetical protein
MRGIMEMPARPMRLGNQAAGVLTIGPSFICQDLTIVRQWLH